MEFQLQNERPRWEEWIRRVAYWERRKFFKLWNELGHSEHAFEALPSKLRRIREVLGELKPARLRREIRFISLFDPAYPAALYELPQPPLGLYVEGQLGSGPFVSIVGSRKPSMYSRRMAREAARVWTEKGLSIVSGGAYGIDAEAHQACVNFGGQTIVVLGGGHDHLYPKAHENLFGEVLKRGGALVSEYPPYAEARQYTFPERNRIIAAMGEALFLAQAHQKSGSLLTARTALDLGREIWVLRPVPGDENYAGGAELIEMGAHCFVSPEDLI